MAGDATLVAMAEQALPAEGEVWVQRKTGERFEVMYAFPKLVGLRPLRRDRTRPIQLTPNNLLQEYEPVVSPGDGHGRSPRAPG
jgi:hypothetical protein